jgi:hypothetical protein
MDIRSSLNNMPKTLDETYERALLTINGEMRQYAQRLFQCLAVSIRPLRVEELADILAVRFDEGAFPKFNPDWRLGDAQEAVLSVCSNLISIVDVHGSQIVQFSHFSVKEFLTSSRLATAMEDLSAYHIVPRSAHTILAQASLSVLLQLDDHIDKDGIKDFPLSSYAAQHWVEHGQFEGVSSAIQVATEHLFNPEKPPFANWLWIYDMDYPWREEMPDDVPRTTGGSAIILRCPLWFPPAHRTLDRQLPGRRRCQGRVLRESVVSCIRQGRHRRCLVTPSARRKCECLGRERQKLTSPSSGKRTHVDVADLLFKHGADVDLRNTEGDSALALASFAGANGDIASISAAWREREFPEPRRLYFTISSSSKWTSGCRSVLA